MKSISLHNVSYYKRCFFLFFVFAFGFHFSNAQVCFLKKFEPKYSTFKMELGSYTMYTSSGTKSRPFVTFVGQNCGYQISSKGLKNYFIKVPESYTYYKKAHQFYTAGKLVSFVGGIGCLIAGANLQSTPLLIGGAVSFFGGFAISFQGRKMIMKAIPAYNKGMGF